VLPDSRQAAVLAPLFEEDGQARVILTRRTTTLPSHQGEVSFPGGKAMPDEPPVDAALRESREEIGLDPSAVEIVAELDHLATIASRFVLAPFVGVLAGRPALVPNAAEVDEVLDVALRDLAGPGVFVEERWDVAALADRPVYFFELPNGEDVVWGATARILHHFLTVVLTGRTERPPPAL
jgi:8-oxo-dGTP pyrophosphatase MutT (NUDIX family)